MTEPMRKVEGRPAAPGIAIGRAVRVMGRQVEVYRLPLSEGDLDGEIERLRTALRRAARELEGTRDRARESLGRELANIFDAHLLVLRDSKFQDEIERRIRNEMVNAEWAVHETADELRSRFQQLQSEHFRERGEDLRDVAQHVQRALGGVSLHDLSELEGEAIVVAEDLTPSDAVRLGRERVQAFALEHGGSTSHTAIIARSLHVPLVTGLEGVTALVTDNDPVVVDGESGCLVLHPTAEILNDYRGRQLRLEERAHELEPVTALPSVTRDGVPVQLLANIDLPEEIDEAVHWGAAGIGLYRSEFLFIEKSPELPSEEEHLATYRRLVETIHPHPVVIRTFDLGGRKLAREVLETHEENPVLGLRGIRLMLARPDVFRIQVRALYRAGLTGDLRLMLPLVSSLEEVRSFKEFAARELEGLRREGVPAAERLKLGVMIEVPAAALSAEALAREVDFLSIGTNDLIQYSMAADRSNEQVSSLYRPTHPAILRMIRWTVEGAGRAGAGVSLCGEMAADLRYAPLLVGLGLRSLSISPRLIPEIKQRIRELSATELEAVAMKALEMTTADEVEELLDERLPRAAADRRRG